MFYYSRGYTEPLVLRKRDSAVSKLGQALTPRLRDGAKRLLSTNGLVNAKKITFLSETHVKLGVILLELGKIRELAVKSSVLWLWLSR